MESSSGSKKPEGLASRFFLMSFWGRLSGDGDAIGIATGLRLSRQFVAMLRHHDFRPSKAALLCRRSGDGEAIGIATRLRLSRQFVAMLRHHDFRPSKAALLCRRSGDDDAIGIDLVQNNIIRISTSIFDEFEVVI